jgi:hypothetical protein
MEQPDATQRVKALLLGLKGIAGVSRDEDGITVYLEEDSEEVRARVHTAVESVGFRGSVRFVVTGPFHFL